MNKKLEESGSNLLKKVKSILAPAISIAMVVTYWGYALLMLVLAMIGFEYIFHIEINIIIFLLLFAIIPFSGVIFYFFGIYGGYTIGAISPFGYIPFFISLLPLIFIVFSLILIPTFKIVNVLNLFKFRLKKD